MISPDVDSFWPTSVIGWLTFATLATAVGKTAYDWVTGRRKTLTTLNQKIDGVSASIEDMEGKLHVVDGLTTTVRELVYEWRGLDGKNGYKSIIRENARQIAEINRRHDRLDAIREEDERRSGGQRRRAIDRELDRLKDEE